MAGCIRFQQIAPRAGLEQLLDQRLAVMHRKNQNFRLGQTRPNLPRRLHAVDTRQRIIEDGNVRLSLRRLADRLLAVGGLGNDLPVWLRGEDSAEARANDFVVICNQNAHRSCLLLSMHPCFPLQVQQIDALCRHPRKPRKPSEVNALGIAPGQSNARRAGQASGPSLVPGTQPRTQAKGVGSSCSVAALPQDGALGRAGRCSRARPGSEPWRKPCGKSCTRTLLGSPTTSGSAQVGRSKMAVVMSSPLRASRTMNGTDISCQAYKSSMVM